MHAADWLLRRRRGCERAALVVALLLSANANPVVGFDRLGSSGVFCLYDAVSRDRIVPLSTVLVDSRDTSLGDDCNFRRRILRQIILKCLKSVGGVAQPRLRVGLLDDGETGESSVRVDGERLI